MYEDFDLMHLHATLIDHSNNEVDSNWVETANDNADKPVTVDFRGEVTGKDFNKGPARMTGEFGAKFNSPSGSTTTITIGGNNGGHKYGAVKFTKPF